MSSYEDTQEANAAEQKDAEFEAQSAKNADVRARHPLGQAGRVWACRNCGQFNTVTENACMACGNVR